MPPPLLTLQNIHLTFGGTPLLEGAEFSVFENDRVCLVGRNGSGKSTLLKIAAGLVEADQGERFVKPGVTWRYLEQEPDLSRFETAEDYAVSELGPQGDRHRAHALLNALGLRGTEQTTSLSGGEIRRAALAKALAPDPEILFLDEPTNHLDLPAIEWLESTLGASRAALVVISHDRRFLENLSTRTVWLDRGETRNVDRGFKDFETWRDDFFEQEERDRHKLDRKIVREQHWVVHGVSGRRKRNMKRLSDLAKLRSERQRLAERSARAQDKVALKTTDAQASGKVVMEVEELSKAWGDNVLVNDLSLTIHRGDRIGIVGPNGTGKTTLLKLLIGELAPDVGTVRHGTKLELISLDQKREHLAPATTLKEALTEGRGDMVMVGSKQRHVMSYMKDFLFQTEQAGTPIERLSGGERGRLMLARAFAKPSNVMVLDEPTNDLDLETLDLLQELIADYQGTVLLVSHDRDFLDRVVTSVVANNGEGHWQEYVGGYAELLAKLRPAAQSTAKQPKPEMKERTPKKTPSPAARTKLTFKDKHALETLPGDIAAAETKIEQLKVKLAEPDFFQKDAAGFNKAAEELSALETQLGQMEEEWLRLEMLREELEG